MRKTSNIQTLASLLADYPFDNDSIINRFEGHGNFDKDKEVYFNTYLLSFSKISVELAIEDLILDQKMDINIIPLEDKMVEKEVRRTEKEVTITWKKVNSKDYRFEYTSGGRLFSHPKYESSDLVAQQQYDNLIKIDNIPVVVNVAISPWKKYKYQRT